MKSIESASNTPREEDRAGVSSPQDDFERESGERNVAPERPRRRRRSRTQARGERGERSERGERGSDRPEPVAAPPVPNGESASLPNGPQPQVYRDLIAPERIDPDAVKVLKRLTRHGHTAYLV